MTPNTRVPLGASTLPRRHALLMTGDYIVTNLDELSSGSHETLHFASHGLLPSSQSCPARAPKNPSDHAAIGPYLVQPPRTRATTRTRRANVSTPGGLMTRAVNGNVERPCQHPAQPNPWRADGSLSESLDVAAFVDHHARAPVACRRRRRPGAVKDDNGRHSLIRTVRSPRSPLSRAVKQRDCLENGVKPLCVG